MKRGGFDAHSPPAPICHRHHGHEVIDKAIFRSNPGSRCAGGERLALLIPDFSHDRRQQSPQQDGMDSHSP
ncbi:hypothetical protein [Novosphingobium capsulatum]|uniref:hypothetical protein n=1 Tax=Novosphingobium capsulatum TaxID=13688 RepID=UPI00286B8169|nr:hypothetical protein [Novosphingobium capsulatum]